MLTSFRAVVCSMLAAGLLIGCGSSNSSPSSPSPGPTTGPVNFTFDISPGQSFLAEDNSFTIQFDRVTEDSRCPAAANCIQLGQAALQLLAREGTARAQPLTLTTTPGKNADQVGRFTFTLERLTPYPMQSFDEIPAEAYRATLRVTRP